MASCERFRNLKQGEMFRMANSIRALPCLKINENEFSLAENQLIGLHPDAVVYQIEERFKAPHWMEKLSRELLTDPGV